MFTNGLQDCPRLLPSPNRVAMESEGPGNLVRHPTRSDWRRFLAGELDAREGKELSAHLEVCRRCMGVFARMPPPTYYSLGRPLPPTFALSPMEIETQATRLVKQLVERVRPGGLFLLAGDTLFETSLYLLVSLSATRLRRLGYSTAVCGQVFSTDRLPARPNVDVAILLEASAYSNWSTWGGTQDRRLNVFVGCVEDWGAIDFVVGSSDSERTREAFARRLLAFDTMWKLSKDAAVRRGLLLNALGVDCPPGFFRCAELPVPFEHTETQTGAPTGWSSVEAQWTAWKALHKLLKPHDITSALESLVMFPQAARRLYWRAVRRGLTC